MYFINYTDIAIDNIFLKLVQNLVEKNLKFLIASLSLSFYINQFSIKQFTGVFSPENFEILSASFIYLRINIIKSEQIDKNL